MNNSQKVYELGYSLWYDNIQRKLLENGELAGMIERGEIYGVTSNPSIFHNAIAKTNDYDDDLIPLAKSGKTAEEIFEVLAIEDIRGAADLFTELYEKTNGADGYVSLEVNPTLAADTKATLSEAKRLWKLVDRPNLMVKIPATKEGLPAIRKAIAAGINVNVTLIFSVKRYEEVMEAYISGLEDRVKKELPVDKIASVASFFISRMDSKIDAELENISGGEGYYGKAAIANAKIAYGKFQKIFDTYRFHLLTNLGARVQRPLWASTSTKNPDYPDTLYVDSLIGTDVVNTVPPKTLSSFLHHGKVVFSLESGRISSEQLISDIESFGILIDKVTQNLEDEGVASFSKAFKELLESVEVRRLEAIS